jgi:hypothetical protein
MLIDKKFAHGESAAMSCSMKGLFYERAVKRKHLSSCWLLLFPSAANPASTLTLRSRSTTACAYPARLRLYSPETFLSLRSLVISVDANRLFYLRLCVAYCYLRLCEGAYG